MKNGSGIQGRTTDGQQADEVTANEAAPSLNPAAIVVTYVWTDGLGTFQGRCAHCGWRGRWLRSEAMAARAATHHAEEVHA